MAVSSRCGLARLLNVRHTYRATLISTGNRQENIKDNISAGRFSPEDNSMPKFSSASRRQYRRLLQCGETKTPKNMAINYT